MSSYTNVGELKLKFEKFEKSLALLKSRGHCLNIAVFVKIVVQANIIYNYSYKAFIWKFDNLKDVWILLQNVL